MSATFLITSLIIVALPGTGAILTISAGLAHGRRASMVTAFGCTLGTTPHLATAITGAATLLRDSGIAFEIVRAAGVIYLLLMAWSAWRDASPLQLSVDSHRSSFQAICSAILANLLNPKLTIFFFVFRPQFVPRDSASRITDMLILGAVFMAMTFAVFVIYGMFAAGARHHLIDRPHVIRHIRKGLAVSFIALSAKLATAGR